MIHLQLFFEFFRIGLLTIGGGMASIPLLHHLAEKTAWYPASLVTDMIAIAESTPGPIGINMATYAGYTVAGASGALLATLGMLAPSIIIVSIVARYLARFRHSAAYKDAFNGLRPAVTALIAAAGLDILSAVLLQPEHYSASGRLLEILNPWSLVFFALIFILLSRYKKHPIFYIAISAAVGLLVGF